MIWTCAAPVRVLKVSGVINRHTHDEAMGTETHHTHLLTYDGFCCRLGLILPISKDHMVWTCAAPVRMLESAGVKFDPTNGGNFRPSTQAVSDTPENALSVSP